MIKVKKFKETLENTVIPVTQTRDNGKVGRKIEEILKKKGLPIDSRATGADISDGTYEIEIKSHKKGSNADVSISTISVENISAQPFQNSIVKSKVKTVRYVEYDENSPFVEPGSSVVKSDRVLDLTDEAIQKAIEYQYDLHRNEIATNNDQYKIGTRIGWWEKKSSSSWAFRIPFSEWKSYVSFNDTKENFDNMFSKN